MVNSQYNICTVFMGSTNTTIHLADISIQAKKIAQTVRGGDIFALIGPLGAGKTTFVKHIAKELGIRRKITSPTFTLMNIYPIPKHNTAGAFLYHLDLYRTNSFAEVAGLGITEVWGKKDVITFIEWADKIDTELPKKTKRLFFSHV